MSEEQALQSETCWIVAAVRDSGTMLGEDQHGFHHLSPRISRGYDSLLVTVEYATKMMVLRPTHSTATAVDTARTFVTRW